MFEATRLWLKERLGLEISPENRLATHISVDFSKLSYGLKLQMTNRLRELTPKGKLERRFIKERYGKSKQLRFLNGHPLIPVGYVQTRNA